MKNALLIILILLSAQAFAGGSQFELQVIDFKKSASGGYELSFHQLTLSHLALCKITAFRMK
jgi:hypothetical protein